MSKFFRGPKSSSEDSTSESVPHVEQVEATTTASPPVVQSEHSTGPSISFRSNSAQSDLKDNFNVLKNSMEAIPEENALKQPFALFVSVVEKMNETMNEKIEKVNEKTELGFDRLYTSIDSINGHMKAVLGQNKSKDDVSTIIEYQGKMYLQKKYETHVAMNYILVLGNGARVEIDLFCSDVKNSKYAYIIGECTSVIFDDEEVERCVKRRDQLAALKGIKTDSILGYVFAVRIHPPVRDAVIQTAINSGIKLRLSDEVDIAKYQSLLRPISSE